MAGIGSTEISMSSSTGGGLSGLNLGSTYADATGNRPKLKMSPAVAMNVLEDKDFENEIAINGIKQRLEELVREIRMWTDIVSRADYLNQTKQSYSTISVPIRVLSGENPHFSNTAFVHSGRALPPERAPKIDLAQLFNIPEARLTIIRNTLAPELQPFLDLTKGKVKVPQYKIAPGKHEEYIQKITKAIVNGIGVSDDNKGRVEHIQKQVTDQLEKSLKDGKPFTVVDILKGIEGAGDFVKKANEDLNVKSPDGKFIIKKKEAEGKPPIEIPPKADGTIDIAPGTSVINAPLSSDQIQTIKNNLTTELLKEDPLKTKTGDVEIEVDLKEKQQNDPTLFNYLANVQNSDLYLKLAPVLDFYNFTGTDAANPQAADFYGSAKAVKFDQVRDPVTNRDYNIPIFAPMKAGDPLSTRAGSVDMYPDRSKYYAQEQLNVTYQEQKTKNNDLSILTYLQRMIQNWKQANQQTAMRTAQEIGRGGSGGGGQG